ncbi:MAG: glucose-6-phosphate isomerase [Legionellales bacterium RIFCSPHIGHO2_12_FULL_37_14]|nr:MAG: glucose-6-phosphate isomerase [Legionellales bacterium RIFCSPHIGHO2_12_FULL_37_14]
MKQVTDLSAWKALAKEARNVYSSQQTYTAATHHINLDYSHQKVNQPILELLFTLADECKLKAQIKALLTGESVNYNENSAALHTALRVFDNNPIWVNQHNVVPDIIATREQMRLIANQIRQKEWLGYSGKPITDIVNIGIGGSDLGPKFCLKALATYKTPSLGFHFISDADPDAFHLCTKNLAPETTLFLISSKSFSTIETLYNAKKALAFINRPKHIDKHFIAITANKAKALEFGFNNVLPIWTWVGGRFSVCSAINLITVIAIGFEAFNEFLLGAHNMDLHFANNDFSANLPVILALLSVWNNNFLAIHNLLVLVYSQYLEYFPSYLQQLEMESNGKSVDKAGNFVNYQTAPIIWGGLGNQAMHSYYQLLCQGTHQITTDLIQFHLHDQELIKELAVNKKAILTKGVKDTRYPHQQIKGQMPLNQITLDIPSPSAIGELIALYEHKTYVESVIWNINCFDQPGVESAKSQSKITHHYVSAS